MRQMVRGDGVATEQVLAARNGSTMTRVAAAAGTVVTYVVKIHPSRDRPDLPLVANAMDVLRTTTNAHLSVTVGGRSADPNVTAASILYPAGRVLTAWTPSDEAARNCRLTSHRDL